MLNQTVRKIHNTNSTKVIGLFYSHKMRGHLPWESTLERDWLLWLDYRPDVISFRCQPATFNFFDDEGNQRRYTPDMSAMLVGRDEPVYFEVKPEDIASSRRFQTTFACQRASIECRHASLEFVTETVIRCEPQLTNLKQLKHYANLPAINPVDKDEVRALMALKPCWTISELVAAAIGNNFGLPEIFREIYHGMLWVDLSLPLDQSSRVYWKEVEHGA